MKIWDEAEIKRTPAEWGLQWVWDHPEVAVVLSGMSSMQQVKENIQSAEHGYAHSLTEQELQLIDRVKREYKQRIKVDCTNCGYCMPCPNGVNIPDCFGRYNPAFMFGNVEEMKNIIDGQQILFVNDEKSALTWLNNFLNTLRSFSEISTAYNQILTKF